MSNHKLAMIREEQREANYPPYGIDLTNPDFAAYAESCGGAGIRVARPQDLADARLTATVPGKRGFPDIDSGGSSEHSLFAPR